MHRDEHRDPNQEEATNSQRAWKCDPERQEALDARRVSCLSIFTACHRYWSSLSALATGSPEATALLLFSVSSGHPLMVYQHRAGRVGRE